MPVSDHEPVMGADTSSCKLWISDRMILSLQTRSAEKPTTASES